MKKNAIIYIDDTTAQVTKALVKPRIEKPFPLFIWVECTSIIVRAAGLVLVTRYPWFTQIYEERTSTR